jgi:hypothetical protein
MILSKTKQQQIKKVAINDENRLLQIMQETESFELPQLLGIAFYQAIDETPANYTALLEGASFEYCGNTIKHVGLYNVIAYLNYSNYIEESNIMDTATGLKHKQTEQSEHVGIGTIKNLQNKNRELAMLWWKTIKDYLNENSSLYPLWNCTTSKKANTPIFYGIKSTH